MVRRGQAGLGSAGVARPGIVSRGEAGQGRPGVAGSARRDRAGRGPARPGVAVKVRLGVARHGRARQAGRGGSRRGVDRLGMAGMEPTAGFAAGQWASVAALNATTTGGHNVATATKNGSSKNGSTKRIEIPEIGTLPGDNANGRKAESLTITAPKFAVLELKIRSTAPFVQLRFGEKSKNAIREKHAAGSVAGKGKKREPKDFNALYTDAMYQSAEGWRGFPAPAIRKAAISACRIVGFKMTLAKLGIFTIADGFDAKDGTPLVRFTKGEPQHCEHMVNNATGVPDIRVRAMWPTWEAMLHIRYDAEMFTASDVANLIARVGMQVGIGEGRPDSKNSGGMDWGTFEIVND